MIIFDSTSTICAVATPNGKGGIAVIRLSGSKAFEIVAPLLSHDIEGRKSHTLFLAEISDKEGVVDEVVVSLFNAPHSYTGENTVEISCHASQYIQQRILSALIEQGACMASAGEFTMRAFLNGRLDLVQAEAVADLIASENKSSHLLALNQLKGGVSSEIKLLKDRLMELAALVELELDFSEEDVEFADRDDLKSILLDLRIEAEKLRSSFATGNAIKEGVPIAIIGRPNAGKSTLLNALLNEERAIVSDVPGTTRDAIEDVLVMDGIKFRFIDTAGLRETDDKVERAGIDRTHEKMRKASIWLYIFDVSLFDDLASAYDAACADVDELKYSVLGDGSSDCGCGNSDNLLCTPKVLYIGNKCGEGEEGGGVAGSVAVGGRFDKNAGEVGSKFDGGDMESVMGHDYTVFEATYPNLIPISAKYKKGIDLLSEKLVKLSNIGNGSDGKDVILSNVRHYQVLGQLLENIKQVEIGIESGLSGDLLAIDIRRALSNLGEITGEIVANDILGLIFGKFCIGK